MKRGPGAAIKGSGAKPKNFWKTSKRLLAYMSTKVYALLVVFILAIASTIFQIRTPKILGEATTKITKALVTYAVKVKQGVPNAKIEMPYDAIWHILELVLILYLISAVFTFFQQFIMTRVSQRTVYQMRRDLKEKMNRVPMKYYDTHNNGDIMSRAVNDMDNIANTLQQSLTQMLTSIVLFFGVLYMMLTISIKLTLVVLATLPLSILVVAVIAPQSQKLFAKQQKNLGLLNNQVEENYSGNLIIQSFGQEEKAIATFKEQNEELYQASWRAQFISGIIFPMMNFVKNLGYVFIAIVGGIMVTHKTVSIGNVQAMLQYANQFSQPITQIANLLNTIQSTVASAERIFEVLDEPEMTETLEKGAVRKEGAPKMAFEHVQFGYGDDLLMTDFNLAVEEGQMVAIVGPTGAGKTTMINLIERFYDISNGSIQLDGQDTRQMSREELRGQMAMVLQDTWLFTGTIYENIHYGNEDASEEDVYRAARAAHADDFVRKLPDGYATVLDEDASNISQGQRQLVTIARAFLANPDILILDEATSSVDTRTEVLIQKAMNRLLKNRTSFVVAHRLSTIRDADNILVMNHGSVIETGTHDELMAKQGFYADLYNSQFQET